VATCLLSADAWCFACCPQVFCSQEEGDEPAPSAGVGSHAAQDGVPRFRSQLPGTAAGFDAFCRGALYECVAGEKPGAVRDYLQLYCLVQVGIPQRLSQFAGLPLGLGHLSYIMGMLCLGDTT
jgi:hypothetical protein